ncbi:MAG: B12-binding domain-containing radical SAM protein [Oscillospiraceae bacterium]|nr:B12-binding domain-containing radical SAM protein [Oscillospiraceae bacterium]
MNITLLAINTKYVHSSLAVWAVASGIAVHAQQAHAVSVIEATINQDYAEIAQRVIAQQPDVLGISAYIWNAHMLPQLIAQLRRHLPNLIIVLGGPEVACNEQHWQNQGADHVIQGPGEQQFAALLDTLEQENSATCRGGNFAARSPQKYTGPYSDAYFSALAGRIAYIETSRGCPFRCSYCLSGNQKLEFVPLALAKEQITKLTQSGTRTIKFVDRTFNANTQRACDIWTHVLSLNSNCCFHFEVAADLFDEQSLALLAAAAPARIQLEIGLQSFHSPTLSAVQRKTNLEQAEKNIRRLVAADNIHVHVDLIAGLPQETLATFEQGFNRAYALGAHKLQLGFLKLLHGSELRDQAQELGLVYAKEPPYEIVRSPWMSESDLAWLKTAENALQHTYNQSRFLRTLRYVLAVSQLSPLQLFHGMGSAAPHHATALEHYATQLYAYFRALPNVEDEPLRDHMLCDMLSMTKGQSMPAFLKCYDKKRKQVLHHANAALARNICACEVAVLSDGRGVYVDSRKQNPITGLYLLEFC